jgi:outer membrane protein assembly factor BamB
MKTQISVLLTFVFLLGLYSCSKSPTLSSLKEINSFRLLKSDGSSFTPGEISIRFNKDSIIVTVPYNTSLNPLTPLFNFTGISVSPASGIPQNFNTTVPYTVTAEDKTTAVYKVIVIRQNPPGIVYFGCDDNYFYAVDPVTGKLVWKYKGNSAFSYSSPTYANGIIYVGGIDNYVYAFDALTGEIKWKKNIASTGIESDAVYHEGTIYVGTNDDYLYALDANTGNIKWNYQTGGNVSASPTISNNTVYFGSSDGRLYALDAFTGSLKWNYQTGAMINQSGPALVNGIIYVGSRDSYLYAINAASGNLVWKFYANGISFEQSSPSVAGGIVYIGAWYNVNNFSEKGCFYAVNATTGELVWKQLNNTGVSSSPTVVNGIVYFTADDLKIHAMNASTGAALWSKEILPNSASPAVSGDVVFVGGGGTRFFYALNAFNGTEKWRFGLGTNGLSTSCPLILNGEGKADYAGDSGLLQ